MRVLTAEKQARLDDAWEVSQAASPTITLRAQLRLFEKSALDSLSGSGGAPIISTSANGHRVDFSGDFDQVSSPQQRAAMWRELINLYDQVKGFLGISSTETDVYTEMASRLRPVTEFAASDFHGLRL